VLAFLLNKPPDKIIPIVKGREGILGKNTVVNLGPNREKDYLTSGILLVSNASEKIIKISNINYRELIRTFERGEWKIINVGTWEGKVRVDFCVLQNTAQNSLFSGCKMRIFADRLVRKK
jgi:hypothetical protein